MSSRKKRSSFIDTTPVQVPRAKPLRDLPTPPPKPETPPEQFVNGGFGNRIPEVTVRTPMIGEAVPLIDPTLQVRQDSFVDMRELRDNIRTAISDANGNRQMLEMWQERHGGSLGDAMQALHGGQREQERFTATQALEQQRNRASDATLTFNEAAQICRYVRGATYGTVSSRFTPMDSLAFRTHQRGVVDLPGGTRMQLELPEGCDNVLAYFNAYAKSRAEFELLPTALRRAQSAFPMMQWRQSFGIAIDGFITFFFVGTMGGPNEYYAFAVNTRNWYEWRIVNPRNSFSDCIQEALFRVTTAAYPELRGLGQGR